MIHLMTAKSDEIKQARWSLIQHALDEICNVPSYSNFRSNTFYVIAKLGLQLKKREEKLFDTDDWHNPKCRDELIKKIREFLIKHIR